MEIRKDDIEDAVVRPLYSDETEDFGINEDDLPEGEEMDNGQEVLENIKTKTVTEERQKIVTKTKINKFAIVGIIVGLLIVVCGVCVIIGIPGNLGLEIDYRLGYILCVMGAYMFCSFGMHVKQNEFQVETFTVEKQVPVEALPYDANRMEQRDSEIDAKVNEMAEMFRNLAMLTSELEEKIVQREAADLDENKSAEQSEMLANAAATAVVAAMREERKNTDEYKEAEAMRLEAEQMVAEEKARVEELRAHIEEQKRKSFEDSEKAAEEIRLAKEEAEKAAEEIRLAKEEAERIAEEKRLFAEEAERAAEERRLAEEENARLVEEERARLSEEIRLAREEAERIAEERRAALEEAARLSEEMRLAEERRKAEEEAARLAEERRKAEEEAARIAEEMRLAEERRKAEEEELRRLEEERRRAEEEAARIAEEIRLAEERRKAEEEERRRAEAEAINAEKERLASLGLTTSTFAWSSNLGSVSDMPAEQEEKENEPVNEDLIAEVGETVPVAEYAAEESVPEIEDVAENGETVPEFMSVLEGFEEVFAEEVAETEENSVWFNEQAEEPVGDFSSFANETTEENEPASESNSEQQPESIWPDIPPIAGYGATTSYSSILDEEPKLTEEEERQLAEEKEARAKRIQEQLAKMYERKWDDIPLDDLSDLEEGPIIF